MYKVPSEDSFVTDIVPYFSINVYIHRFNLVLFQRH